MEGRYHASIARSATKADRHGAPMSARTHNPGPAPPLSAPVLFLFALHSWCRRILALDPVTRATGAVGRAKALRHDTFEPKLAGVAEDDIAGLINVLVEQQARFGVAQELSERCLTRFDGLAAQVLTIKLDQ